MSLTLEVAGIRITAKDGSYTRNGNIVSIPSLQSIFELADDTPAPIHFAEQHLGAPKETASGEDIPDISKWKKVGPQLGSNPGGNHWYVKHSHSDDHARNEITANELYKHMGVPVLDHKLVRNKQGRLSTASPWTQAKPFNPRNPEHLKDIQKHFAPHAFVSNWDSIGLENDNQAHTHKGMTTLDPGGSLRYRAMGSPKGDAFGHKVTEWDSMRNPKINENSAHVYGPMSDKDRQQSAMAVRDLPDHKIHEIVKQHGPLDPKVNAHLTNTLLARKGDILQRAKLKKTV